MYLTKLRSRAELANPRADQENPATRVVEPTDDQRARTAQAIIDAGRRRRGEIPDEPAAEIDSTAAAILAAGKKRRNET